MGSLVVVGDSFVSMIPTAAPSRPPVATCPKRVLLVDDSSGFRGLLHMFLSSVPDVEVVGEAADGVEAITAVLRTKPDLVLMDVRMPALNGLQATRRLRVAGVGVPNRSSQRLWRCDSVLARARSGRGRGARQIDAR